MTIRFYAHRATDALAEDAPAPAGYTVSDWRPRRDGSPPADIASSSNTVWRIFDRVGMFANPHCGVLIIRDADGLAHTSLVTPGWFRFPLMAKQDIQIGSTWTAEAKRGQGLARVAIAEINRRWQGQFARSWYIVDSENTASIRVIERMGYALIGEGRRTRPFGVSPLGQFVMNSDPRD